MELGIISEGTGYAIYNNASGIIEITSGSVSAKSTSGIYNNAEGTIKVIGGTVTGYTNGIVNAGKGTVTLGSTSDDLSTSSPAIIGQNSYGISSKNENSTFNFYNGVVKGKAKSSKNDTTIELGGTSHLRPSCGTITKVLGDLYATTLSKIVTVSFEPNGGTNSTSSKDVTFSSEYGLKYDSTKDPLPEPEKDGYIFEGWYLNDSNLIKDDTIVETEENHTLKANWKAITYIIEYDKNADGAMRTTENSTHTYDVAKNLTANGYEYEGYRFKGWNTNANGTGTAYTDKQSVKNLSKKQGDVVTLYAQWEPITYTVIYDGNGATGGSTANSEHVYGVEKALTKNGYTKTGYKFTGWNTNASGSGTHFEDEMEVENLTVEETITLYAQWEPIKYTVVYDGNGATSGTMTSSSHTYDVAKNLTANEYAKTGYVFKGWNTKKDGTGTSYENKASVTNLTITNGAIVTLYAKWGSIEYKVVYNGNGSTGGTTASSTHTYDVEKKLTANGFTKTGYTFKEWNKEKDGSGKSYADEANVKNLESTEGAVVNLYAQWRANTYTVVYDGNGATSGTTESSSHTYNVEKELTENGYTRTGYIFNGWNTKKDGKGKSYKDKESVKNLKAEDEATVTLYAKWTPITYTVVYNGNGATSGETANSEHSYDKAKNLTVNGYVKTGYTFKNWSLNADGTGTTYENQASVKNLTIANGDAIILYAQWEINISKLTIDPNTGSVEVTSPTGGTKETITSSKTYTQSYNSKLTYEKPTKADDVTETTYTVTYDANGGEVSTSSVEAIKTTTTKYTFTGWTKSSTFYGTLSSTTGSGTYTFPANNNDTETITAQFEKNDPTEKTSSVTLPTPTRTGYNCLGWATSKTATSAEYNCGEKFVPEKNITLYAIWDMSKYSVILNKGTGIESVTGAGTYSYGSSVTINATLSPGYHWSKWSGTYNTTEQQYTFTMPASNVTLTANAAINTSTLIVNPDPDGDGTGSASVGGTTITSTKSYTQNYNTTLTVVTPPTKADSTKETEYTVTYNANGGSVSTSSATVTRTTITKFNGSWTKSSTFYGTLSNGVYTFPANNGVTDTLTASYASTVSSDTTTSVTLPTPTRTEYNCLGWSTNSSATTATYSCGAKYTPTADVTLYAVWSQKPIHIYYGVNGGTVSSSTYGTKTAEISGWTYISSDTAGTNYYKQILNPGSICTLHSASDFGLTKTGYSPASGAEWMEMNIKSHPTFTTSTQYSYDDLLPYVYQEGSAHLEVYIWANWQIHSSTLTINPNGGSVSVTSPTGGTATTITSTKSYTQNYNTKLTYGTPTKSNASSTTTYTVTYNYNGSGASNTTASATKTTTTTFAFDKWKIESNYPDNFTSTTGSGTYTFPSNSGVTSTITASYTPSSSSTTTSVTLPTPTRTGYTFTGWYTAASGGTKVGVGGTSYAPPESITLYAQWTANTYTVTFKHYKGNSDNSSYTLNETSTASIAYGTSITISSYKKTYTGFTYSYASNTCSTSGGSPTITTKTITGSCSIGLYYKRNSYTITYNVNGGYWTNGTGPEENPQTKYYGITVNLTSYAPKKDGGYLFKGWSTSSTATAETYKSSGSFTTNANTILYAVYEVATVSSIKINNSSTWIWYNGGTYTVSATITMANQNATVPNINWTLYTKLGSLNKTTTSNNGSVTFTASKYGIEYIYASAGGESTYVTVYCYNIHLDRML